jgi:hypothetical protein
MLQWNWTIFTMYVSRDLRHCSFQPKKIHVQSNNPHQVFISMVVSTFVKLKINLKQIT